MEVKQDYYIVLNTRQGKIKKHVTGDILNLYNIYVDMFSKIRFIDKISIYKKVSKDIIIKEYELIR